MGGFLLEYNPVILLGSHWYNHNMRKIKIFITLFVLYEFLIITVLQIPGYCRAFFNHGFCNANNFKYFLMCVMVPGLLGLFFWWIPEMLRMCCRGKCQCEETHFETKSTKKESGEIIPQEALEHLISAAIIMGVKKFTKSHPKTTKVFDEVIDAVKKAKKKK